MGKKTQAVGKSGSLQTNCLTVSFKSTYSNVKFRLTRSSERSFIKRDRVYTHNEKKLYL